MIQEILGITKDNIQPHHDRVMEEMINYNTDIEYHLQLYTEYEEINGIYKEEFIRNEEERLFTLLGTTSTLLWVYNRIEQFELSYELHKEMKKSFTLIMNEKFPNTNQQDKFHQLVDNMFQTFKEITM